ncbi:MAG: hypothetical protein ACK5JL_03795 [Candidatus Kapaibacterium sp.]|jgi:hypothetical protein
MATVVVESNGRIEKTAVYLNGEQLGGVRELVVNISEDGTFDCVLVYTGDDGQQYTRNPFTEYADHVQTREPAFTEEEASMLQQLSIDSDGSVESTTVCINDEPQDGIVSMFLHIKAPDTQKPTGIRRWFGGARSAGRAEFNADITYRNSDDSIVTESVF